MAAEDDANTQQNAKEEKPNVQTMQIIVRAQDGSELQFKIKRTTPLMKVFVAYCQRKGLTLEDCRFVADGNLLTAKGSEVTPEEADLEDGDIIDCMQTQLGGSSASCTSLSTPSSLCSSASLCNNFGQK